MRTSMSASTSTRQPASSSCSTARVRCFSRPSSRPPRPRCASSSRGSRGGCAGRGVYSASKREQWLEKLENEGERFRVSGLLEQLDALRGLSTKAHKAMVAEARRHRAFKGLMTVPGLGEARVAQLIALLDTPHRFRTKRNLWAYAGLAVTQHESSEYRIEGDRVTRAREIGRASCRERGWT